MRTVNPVEHARRRAEIIAAAAQEFAAHGVDGTSTSAIRQRAGIGSGTLFHYFATKREIFHAVFADDLPLVTDLCERALAETDPDAALTLVTDHLIDELSDPLAPGLASAAVLQANRDPAFAALLTSLDAKIRDTLTTVLTRVAALPGRTPVFPPASAARWIQSLVDAAHLSDPDVPRARTSAELRRIIAWLTGAAAP